MHEYRRYRIYIVAFFIRVMPSNTTTDIQNSKEALNVNKSDIMYIIYKLAVKTKVDGNVPVSSFVLQDFVLQNYILRIFT